MVGIKLSPEQIHSAPPVLFGVSRNAGGSL